jgi:hypothetical protein
VRRLALSGALVLSLAAAPAAGARGLPASTVRIGSGPTTLVGVRPDAAFMAVPALRRAGATPLAPSIGLWRVSTPAARRLVPELGRAGALRLVQPERALKRDAVRLNPDPLTPAQWWRSHVGADRSEPPGPGVPLTVIDTGVDLTHPEFSGRPDTIAFNAQRVTDSEDDFHGTAVASVAAAPANGIGLLGVYPQIALRVWDADLSGRLTDGELIRAIDTASRAGVGVMNLSLGSTDFDPALQQIIYAAIRRGSLIVAASGNSREEGNPTNFPANMSHVLTVAATDANDQAAAFSSSSAGVDLAAPGVDIPAAIPTLFGSTGYAAVDGTSFSAPIVAGAAAWVWTVRSDLDNTELFDIMRWSARDVLRPGFDVDTGFGILDIPAALTRPTPGRDPQEPNDDVALIKPGVIFSAGMPALTTPVARSGSLQARLDVTEDPEDVYRFWIPARKSVTATLHGDANVDLEVWRPGTKTVGEGGASLKRDLAGRSEKTGTATDSVTVKNTGAAGAYYYADVYPGKRVGDAAYTLAVKTR